MTIIANVDQEVVNSVVNFAERGSKVMFGRSHTGEIKIKIKYGPLQALTKRYRTTPQTYELIKQQLKLAS